MWEWFTANSVWILTISAIVSILLLFSRHRALGRLKKGEAAKGNKRLYRSVNLVFWAIGGVVLVIMVLAVVAITLSRQGVHTVITSETIQRWLLEHGILILVMVIVSYLVYLFLKLAMPQIVEKSLKLRVKERHSKLWFKNRSQTLSTILTSTIGILIALIAVFMILSEVGIDITPLLAGAGVAGIAIGFGAQSLIKDLVSGLLVLLEDQYNKGDVVKIAGIVGLVEEVNLRRTVLRDLDGIVHSVPNGEITTASNYTRDWARVNLDVPVAYGEDLDHVMAVINRVGKELAEDEYFSKLVHTAPQALRVNNFGDSGIDIKILGETKPMMQWEVTGELRKRLKKAFDEAGIEIPWPHVKLYFGEGQTSEYLTCKACSHPNLLHSRFCSNCGAALNP